MAELWRRVADIDFWIQFQDTQGKEEWKGGQAADNRSLKVISEHPWQVVEGGKKKAELTLSRFFDSLEPHLIEGVSSDRQMPEMSF